MPAGGDLAAAARELSAGAFSAEAIDQQVETLQREMRCHGWADEFWAGSWRNVRNELLQRRKGREYEANAFFASGLPRLK